MVTKIKHEIPDLAIVLAGGKGTRLQPLTLANPKPIIKINGRPIIFSPLDSVIQSGVKKIIITVNYRASQIYEAVNKSYRKRAEIHFAYEKAPMGTGGAIMNALDKYNGDCKNVLVINGDEICNIDLRKVYEFHSAKQALATIVVSKVEDTNGSGVVEMRGDLVTSFVEKPEKSKSDLIARGIYLFSDKGLEQLPSKSAFNLSKDFLEEAAKKRILYGYRSDVPPYAIDTPERYEATKRHFEEMARR